MFNWYGHDVCAAINEDGLASNGSRGAAEQEAGHWGNPVTFVVHIPTNGRHGVRVVGDGGKAGDLARGSGALRAGGQEIGSHAKPGTDGGSQRSGIRFNEGLNGSHGAVLSPDALTVKSGDE